ncbi:MAG TPA: transporter [Candidatus Aquabacterium excrementipullorum]|nr:transporter [Candidatus Aquabacterium excrementipullorum]
MKSKSTRMQTMPLTLLASAIMAAAASSAMAAENRGQRYSPGVGGSDMTSLLVPGWYGQVAMIQYHATKLKDNNGDTVNTVAAGTVPRANIVAGLPSAQQSAANTALAGAGFQGVGYSTRLENFRADVYAALLRVTYLSTSQAFGANLGFTAMLPVVRRQTSLEADTTLSSANMATLGAVVGSTAATAIGDNIRNTVNGQASRNKGQATGLGDLEISPLLHWELGDNQAISFAPTIVVPTGDYNKNSAVNAGYGNFYTFRPSVQYGYIGDGWDVGVRAVLSFNSRNKDTDYKSGNMFNLDFQLMKFVTDDLRLGLQGYVVQQFSDDASGDATTQAAIDLADGNRMRTFALGPALAWIKNGGEMMIEGKFLREFGSQNRTEGTAYWLTISKPFGM